MGLEGVGACWGLEGVSHRHVLFSLFPKTCGCCWSAGTFGLTHMAVHTALTVRQETSVAKDCSQLDAVVSAVTKFQAALSLFANLLSLLIRGLSFALQKLQPSSRLILL